MTIKFTTFAVGVIIALMLVGLFYVHNNTRSCQEDMPCWNCATMGNKVCG